MLDGPTRKQPDIKVTLLGTGGPELTRDRMGAATLIEAGGKPRSLMPAEESSSVYMNAECTLIRLHE